MKQILKINKSVTPKSLLFLLSFIFNSTIILAQPLNLGVPAYDNSQPILTVTQYLTDYPSNTQTMLAKGYLDVTKAPYNASISDNTSDDGLAIQKAIEDGFKYNLVVFFPVGTYNVSKQIRCVSYGSKESRLRGFHLVGSTVPTIVGGTPLSKPVIKLINNVPIANFKLIDSDGKFIYKMSGSGTVSTVLDTSDNVLIRFQFFFVDPRTPKSEYGIDPSRTYMSTFKGIDIDMGNNPRISALSMNGAQYCNIEDVAINGSSFKAGLWKLPGSGGGTINVKVTGGQYGILQDDYRPNPTIFGLELNNQTDTAIVIKNSRGAVVIAGFKILNNISTFKCGISVWDDTRQTYDSAFSNLALTDGSIDIGAANGIAINNNAQDVTVNNVYFKSTKIINMTKSANSSFNINGDILSWRKITNYAFTDLADQGKVVTSNAYLNGASSYQYPAAITLLVQDPPTNFLTKHSWGLLNTDKYGMPSFLDDSISGEKGVIDLTIGFWDNKIISYDINLATQNRKALQAMINAVTNTSNSTTVFGKILFLPKGVFYIDSTITLRAGLRLIGAGKGVSTLVQDVEWTSPSTKPMLNIISGGPASNEAVYNKIFLSEFGLQFYAHQQVLSASAKNLIIKDLYTELKLVTQTLKVSEVLTVNKQGTVPYFKFGANAGGRVYNLVADQIMSQHDRFFYPDWDDSHTIPSDLNPNYVKPTTNYSLLSVDGKTNSDSLTFYHISIEHLENAPQANFNNSKNITVYGFKYEPGFKLLNINSCGNVNLVGGSGNYYLEKRFTGYTDAPLNQIPGFEESDEAMITITSTTANPCSNIKIQNFSKKRAFGKSWILPFVWMKITQGTNSTTIASPNNNLLWYEYAVPTSITTLSTAPIAAITSIPDGLFLKMSPNPTSNIITVNFKKATTDVAAINIISALGQIVKTVNAGSVAYGYITIPISELAAGLYTVQLQSGGKTISAQKLVKY